MGAEQSIAESFGVSICPHGDTSWDDMVKFTELVFGSEGVSGEVLTFVYSFI